MIYEVIDINIEYLLRMNELAFDDIRKKLKPGMSEKDAYSILTQSFEKTSSYPFTVEGDIIGGARTADIEGPATDLQFNIGDNLILDIQPMIDGIFCDTARTFFFGKPEHDRIFAYNAVKEALAGLENLLKPGTVMSDIFREMQRLLGKFGLVCPHHAGHVIGLNRAITPDFVENESSALEEGMLVALEPGVYFEENFGIRLENNYVITSTGCINLFPYPLDINNFIL